MRTLLKVIILFLAITGATTLIYSHTDWRFGDVDFFVRHGWMFLFFITLFPRLTLFVSWLFFGSIAAGGLFWWLGFFFAPRLLIATLATLGYWKTNPALVIIAWLIAFGGESSEKVVITRRMRTTSTRSRHKVDAGSVIEAEYEVRENK